jgi:hypothetical protein
MLDGITVMSKAAESVVVIGCRHPCGIVLDLVNASGQDVKVKLNGQNSAQEGSPIILLSEKDYGITYVDSEFWAKWKELYKDFAPLKTGMIFEAKDERDAKAVHKEVKGEKTGHEPMPQEGNGVKKAD